MKSRIALFAAVAVMLCMTAAWSQSNPDPAELVTVEHDFAAAVADGMNAGFRQFLAPDGIIFRPGPVNGLDYLKDKPESKARLTWEPEYAEMTSAGDFGWTTGPWELAADSAQTPGVLGQYLSIWQRQSDGSLKLVLDLGIVYPERRAVADIGFAKLPAFSAEPLTADALEAARAELMGLDSLCASAIAAPDVLLLRIGQAPIGGAAARAEYLADNPGVATCFPIFAAVAAHGEFGYTYGTGQFLPDEADSDEFEPVGYARLWKRDADGIWQLAADITVPVPVEDNPEENQ